jgi:hypothetical protein
MTYRDDDRDDARAEARAERARTSYRYNCGGASSWSGPCGASDCGSCRNGPAPWEEDEDDEDEDEDAETAETFSLYIAARDYAYTGGACISKGDIYERTTGFTYVDGGERTGYLDPERRLVARSPAHRRHDPIKWERAMRWRESQLKRRRLARRPRP